MLSLSCELSDELGSLDIKLAPCIISNKSFSTSCPNSETLSVLLAVLSILDEVFSNKSLPFPADSFLSKSKLPISASLSSLHVCVNASSSREGSSPLAFGVFRLSVCVNRALLALSGKLLNNLGSFEVESWPSKLDSNWSFSHSIASLVDSICSVENSAVLSIFAHKLLCDSSFPWPAYCLRDVSIFVDGASVSSFCESLDDSSTSHLSFPDAFCELVLFVNEGCAFLSLSCECL